MDATRFTAIHGGDGGGGGVGGAGQTLLATTLQARDLAVEALSTMGSWTAAAMTQCFSRLRRVQFDEEHQRSLLSCHTTEDGSAYHYPDEEAMAELRRRVQKVDLHSQRRPTFAQELEATYNRHKAMEQQQLQQKQQQQRVPTGTARMQRRGGDRQQQQRVGAMIALDDDATPELSTVLLDAEETLNQLLGGDHNAVTDATVAMTADKSDELRRLSVDELLQLRVPSPVELASSPPEKTGADMCEVDAATTKEGLELRRWLQEIDPSRADEYTGYARNFEQQGFAALADLAQLDDSDVEQAMSEVGISKFAHRARLRKAILRLSAEPPSPTNTTTMTVNPAIAG